MLLQGTSAYFSYQRYNMGVDPAFISSFEADQFGAYDETQNNSNNESPFNKQMSGTSYLIIISRFEIPILRLLFLFVCTNHACKLPGGTTDVSR